MEKSMFFKQALDTCLEYTGDRLTYIFNYNVETEDLYYIKSKYPSASVKGVCDALLKLDYYIRREVIETYNALKRS